VQHGNPGFAAWLRGSVAVWRSPPAKSRKPARGLLSEGCSDGIASARVQTRHPGMGAWGIHGTAKSDLAQGHCPCRLSGRKGQIRRKAPKTANRRGRKGQTLGPGQRGGRPFGVRNQTGQPLRRLVVLWVKG
jgi:hypothetical protein